MHARLSCLAAVASLTHAVALSAQPPAVDFDRDVKPLLREKCVGCHGQSQQNGGLRLDRHQSAIVGGGSGVVILPGNSARSPLICPRWGGAPKAVVAQAARDLARDQRPDGWWAELAPLESDAYSTGQLP